ncbi:MAG: hypothetical protein ABFC80_03785 [Coriobacteriales bacterium]
MRAQIIHSYDWEQQAVITPYDSDAAMDGAEIDEVLRDGAIAKTEDDHLMGWAPYVAVVSLSEPSEEKNYYLVDAEALDKLAPATSATQIHARVVAWITHRIAVPEGHRRPRR